MAHCVEQLLMAFLFKAGNHVRKYHCGPGFPNHSVAKMPFDVEGHLGGKMSNWVKFSNLCILSCTASTMA